MAKAAAKTKAPKKKPAPIKTKATKPKPRPKKPVAKAVRKAPVRAVKAAPAPVARRGRGRSKSYDKEIEDLVARGKKAGKIEQREVFELIPDTPSNIDTLDQLYAELAENEIEL